MNNKIEIDKNLEKPIYQQIYDWVINGINDGHLVTGYHLPSINKIATDNQLARETIVKAFRMLQEKGIVKAVHGKGFFIASENLKTNHRIFLLFDTLSAYKETLYEAIHQQFGEETSVDIFFHHYNATTLKNHVKEAAGNYTAYIVLPFDTPEITNLLESIPQDKLYLLDRRPRFYKNEFYGIYQDFHKDVLDALTPLCAKIKTYKKLVLVFRDLLTQLPLELKDGFKDFCRLNKIEHEIIDEPLNKTSIEKNVGYLAIDDNDLVTLVEVANSKHWEIGKDMGIISYNDTPLKKVVASGITVISTSFEDMGRKVAQLVLDNSKECIVNPGALIDRGSF